MKNNIHYSLEAQNDLDEIWEYITFELCNLQSAENIFGFCFLICRRMTTKDRTKYSNDGTAG